MKIWTCTDHDGHWVGVASVVVAPDQETAGDLLRKVLKENGLDATKPFTLEVLDTSVPKAVVLQNGDY